MARTALDAAARRAQAAGIARLGAYLTASCASLFLGLGLATAALPAHAAGTDSTQQEKAEGHLGAELVLRSLSLLGVNYKFGGNSPETGLDCSGLVRHVFREAVGLVLPRRAEEISGQGERIESAQLKPGDLVFFNTLRRAFSHVGVYIGNNQFVHAPSSGGSVRVERLDQAYWTRRFNGARRIELAQVAFPQTAVTASRNVFSPPMLDDAIPAQPAAATRLPLTGTALRRAEFSQRDSATLPYLY